MTNESIITLTETAKNQLLRSLQKHAHTAGVRLSLKKTGCSGWSYVIDYVSNVVEDDIIMPLHESFSLYIEKKSLPFLQGVVIDYIKDGLNAKFHYQNPNQTGECGCGLSFTTDIID